MCYPLAEVGGFVMAVIIIMAVVTTRGIARKRSDAGKLAVRGWSVQYARASEQPQVGVAHVGRTPLAGLPDLL